MKATDLVASRADGTAFAFEHTRIESYEEQPHEGRQLHNLLVPLAADAASLPAATLQVAPNHGNRVCLVEN